MRKSISYKRLRKRPEFLSVQSSGKRFRRRNLVMLTLANESTESRIGLTVSKRVGNAVVRNRIRRRLREITRQKSQLICAGYDYVIIARPDANQAEFKDLWRELTNLLQQVQGWVSSRDC